MQDIELFASWFLNRQDTYAVQDVQGRYQRRYASLSRTVLEAHLQGKETIAVDTMNRQSLAKWLCFDCDASDGLATLGTIQKQLADYGLLTLREASRRGGHLWLLCTAPVLSATLRQLAQMLITEMRQQGIIQTPLEIYPSNDLAAGIRGITHPVRLPLGVHQVTGQRYPFVSWDGHACHRPEEGLSWLLGQYRNAPQAIHTAVRWMERNQQPHERPEPEQSGQREKRFGAIAWANHEVDLLALVARLHPAAAMRPSGRGYIGWCPWHDDAAPDEQGKPGTPSLYVVQDIRYGWSWRCLSTNCGAHDERHMSHTFDWLVWTCAGDISKAVTLAQRFQKEGNEA